MGQHPTRERSLVIDDGAVRVYSGEIREVLGEEIAIAIVNERGETVWRSDESVFSENLPRGPREPTPTPSKRRLAVDTYCYDFPLARDDAPPLTLRLLLSSADAPSLGEVAKQLRPTIECLARQITIDTSLTAKVQIPKRQAREAGLVAQITSQGWDGNLNSTVDNLVDIARIGLSCRCVSVQIPDRGITATAASERKVAELISTMVPRLHGSLIEKRRAVSASLKLSAGANVQLICVPIFAGAREVIGLVVVVDNRLDNVHSKVARTLSAKVSTLTQEQQSDGELLTRNALVERIDATISRQPTLCHSLIYFDADKVHVINDAFGYSAGDRSLAHLKRIILGSAGTNDAVAHLTSDRFALLMPGATSDTAVAKAEQILRLYAQESIDGEEKSIRLSTTAGISSTPAISRGGEELLILAEVAARGAKERGGNQFAVYQDVDASLIQRRSDVDKVGFLQTALIENRFRLYAQRIAPINVESNQKFELLTRLDDALTQANHPGELLSAAERYHLMTALDRWVINTALKAIAETENSLEVNLSTFCINVSAQSLRNDEIINHIESRIAETGVSPDTLCFEITETSLVKHIDAAQRFINRLQRIGCQVALDDFGTGYSSFAYLKFLPVNYLKIDGSFVRDLLENRLSQTLVESVVRIADVIGALTVAEHVETEMVKARLRDLGVHFVQGFAIHKPEPLDTVLHHFGDPTGATTQNVELINLDEYLPSEHRQRAGSPGRR